MTAIAVAGALLAGCAAANPEAGRAAADPANSDNTVTPTQATGAVAGGNVSASTSYPRLAPDQAVSIVRDGMASVDFDRIAVLDNPYPDSDSRYILDVAVESASTKTPDLIRAAWEGCLADGAIAERLAGDATDLEQVIIAPKVRLVLPDGSTTTRGGCGGDVTPGQLFAAQASGVSDDAIAQSVNEVLADNGFDAVSVDVLRPLGPAVAVVATTDDTSDLDARLRRLQDAITNGQPPYEGSYLEVRITDGSSPFVAASAFRSGTSFSGDAGDDPSRQ
jgi:hypothetical protein